MTMTPIRTGPVRTAPRATPKTTQPAAGTPTARQRARLEARPEAKPGRTRARSTVLDAPRADRIRSAAAQRGYARKAQREATRTGVRTRSARRTPFVLMIMALLAGGLICSLWLSTAATGDSYRLDDARTQARDLTEQAEQLRQDVAAMQTAPELAKRAAELGMVPAGEPARLVQHPDGTVEVVGEPTPATAPVPVQPPAPPADPNQPAGQGTAADPNQPAAPPPAGQPPAAGPNPAGPPPVGQQPPPAGGG